MSSKEKKAAEKEAAKAEAKEAARAKAEQKAENKAVKAEAKAAREEAKAEAKQAKEEQKAVKEGQKALKEGQKASKEEQKALKEEQKASKEGQKALKEEQKASKEGQKASKEDRKAAKEGGAGKSSKSKAPSLPPEKIYINRELSWLAFNLRVLQEAADNTVPLLERLKFLMIYQSNLDEFFRVRIGILTHRAMLDPNQKDPFSGMLPLEQIQEVVKVVQEQQTLMESVWKTIRSELKKCNVDVLDFKKISKVDELMSKKQFGDLKDLLVPQIVEANQPLPFLWDGDSYIFVFLGRPTDQRVAIIPINRLPSYLTFEIEGTQKIVLTAHLIRHFLPLLFKKETIIASAVVKVTRNADVFLSDKGEDEDLRQKTTKMLSKRKRELPVRVLVYGKLPDTAKALIVRKFHIPDYSVFYPSVPFDLSFRSCIGKHENFRYEERKPARDLGLKKGEYFRYIEKHDLLFSFPFQSMLPFVDLLYEAADDPEVLSIKITLYRMAASSKIAAALAYAADKGKDVLCVLELRARFDEQNNIDYSEMLEDAGCHVVYGLPNHKVHSKLCVITRQHGGNLSHITQVGTGNYNEVTGEQYTDLSLITSREEVGQEAEMVFASLVNAQIPPEAHALWIAPLSFKSRVIEFLDREIAKGSAGRVAIKANALNNLDIMEKLIECSQAGVKVELFIRGICSLRPGIPGVTDNIVVSSVVGRWLEHSRIYCFGEGEDERMFVGSGDMLNRNLERRVEAFIEVVTPETREQIREILKALRADKEKSRVMRTDGTYIREPGGEGTSSQEALYRYFSKIHVTPVEEEEVPEIVEEVVAEEAAAIETVAEEAEVVESAAEKAEAVEAVAEEAEAVEAAAEETEEVEAAAEEAEAVEAVAVEAEAIATTTEEAEPVEAKAVEAAAEEAEAVETVVEETVSEGTAAEEAIAESAAEAEAEAVAVEVTAEEAKAVEALAEEAVVLETGAEEAETKEVAAEKAAEKTVLPEEAAPKTTAEEAFEQKTQAAEAAGEAIEKKPQATEGAALPRRAPARQKNKAPVQKKKRSNRKRKKRR